MFYQNLIETFMCWLLLNFLIGNPTQNVYNGKFANVNNEFKVTNVRNYKFTMIFHNSLIFAASHRLPAIFT